MFVLRGAPRGTFKDYRPGLAPNGHRDARMLCQSAADRGDIYDARSHPRHGCATLEPPEVLVGFLSSTLATGTLEVSAGAYLGTGSCESPPMSTPRPKATASYAAGQSTLQVENSRRSRLRPAKRRR
jgi:hypothetical protein